MEKTHDHAEAIKLARENMPKDELLCDLGDLFKIFGDTTRIKILYLLFESELCVLDMTELLGMEQSAVSHQLRILKDAKLIANRREGKMNVYFLSDDHVRSIIGQGFEHLTEEGGAE
ncbi:MAG: helix-turn-helix transcriptional regulator [Clostridia bacterium]|nr:helix-turn-helix transcriptional regulator [Clostridia bacterium]